MYSSFGYFYLAVFQILAKYMHLMIDDSIDFWGRHLFESGPKYGNSYNRKVITYIIN